MAEHLHNPSRRGQAAPIPAPTARPEVRRRRAHPALLLVILVAGCSGIVPPVPLDFPHREAGAREHAESLRASAQSIIDHRSNTGRRSAVIARAAELGIADLLRTEWIDWFSFQDNVLIEIPGTGQGIVYIVAHYDKADSNWLRIPSLLLNGLLEEAIGWSYLGDGAVDNAGSVAVIIELGRALRDLRLRRTYRILLCGSEESGMRGSRAHMARIPQEERERIRLAVNLEGVGTDLGANSVVLGPTQLHDALVTMQTATRCALPLEAGRWPRGAGGDHLPFLRAGFFPDLLFGIASNLAGGLLPQRSWFSGSYSGRVIVFSSIALDHFDGTDFIGNLLFIPVGRLHGPRDRAERLDPTRLYEMYRIVLELLLTLEDTEEGREGDAAMPAPVP